jgi:hypothetical protein
MSIIFYIEMVKLKKRMSPCVILKNSRQRNLFGFFKFQNGVSLA